MNIEPIKHIELDGNHFKEMHPDTYSITRYIGVQVVDAMEQIIHDAIIAAAKDAGLTDLYLFDRRFIVDAIREKQERENPQPLTLEELKERVGKPIWAEWLLVEDRKIETGGWFIVVKTKNGFEVKRPLDFGSHVCKLGNYGTGWLAYDHEPKEAR